MVAPPEYSSGLNRRKTGSTTGSSIIPSSCVALIRPGQPFARAGVLGSRMSSETYRPFFVSAVTRNRTARRSRVQRPLRVARMVGSRKDLLHAVKEVARDNRLVKPLVQLSEPVELAVVDRVLKQLMGLRLHQRATTRPVLRPAAAALWVSTFREYSPEAYHSNSLTMIGARSGSGSIRCVTRLFR